MGAEIVDVSDRVVTFQVTGILKHSEFAAVQQQAEELIRQQGKVRFLVLFQDFSGAEKTGDWGDVSFMARNDPCIEKIAIVGEARWKDMTLLFTGKGIRRVPIEYFAPADLAKARTWLGQP